MINKFFRQVALARGALEAAQGLAVNFEGGKIPFTSYQALADARINIEEAMKIAVREDLVRGDNDSSPLADGDPR